jgi:hypothetical protein
MGRQMNLQYKRLQVKRKPNCRHQHQHIIARGVKVARLTKKESFAVLAVYYGKQESDKKNKPILVEIFKAEIELNENVLNSMQMKIPDDHNLVIIRPIKYIYMPLIKIGKAVHLAHAWVHWYNG